MAGETLFRQARHRLDSKPVRYSMVSAISVVVAQVALILSHGVLDWSAVPSNLFSVSIGCIPSYTLNRYWVWGKRGPNHLWKEVAPFWAMTILGLILSTVLVYLAAGWRDTTLVVSGANLAGFGIVWVAKYLVLDQLLFGNGPDEVAGAEAPSQAELRSGALHG